MKRKLIALSHSHHKEITLALKYVSVTCVTIGCLYLLYLFIMLTRIIHNKTWIKAYEYVPLNVSFKT